MPKINLKDLGNAQVALLEIPNEQYSGIIVDVAKQLAGQYKHVCYVSLNKPYDLLVESFKAKKVDIDKFFFVDCISKGVVRRSKKMKNCEFVSGPHALTEMHISIARNLNAKKCDALFFDSLSTLLTYQRELFVIRFVHAVIGTIRGMGIKGFLAVLTGDVESNLVKNLSMFTDRTIRF